VYESEWKRVIIYCLCLTCMKHSNFDYLIDTEPENIILYPYLKRTVCCQNIKSFG